ncbi:MAG TPA: hypothetical protein VK421_19965 [Pyrinomonadaceae bacterium]|nr:hypothetical protein [Pyrinomonadaceae bacterium]
MIVNRRDFMRVAGVGLAGWLTDASLGQFALAQPARPTEPLIKSVAAACQRLARHGWRDLLLNVTGNELDLTAANLAGELAKTLTAIRRDLPGFEDFAFEGQQGITQGRPAHSLLFHALASPAVLQGAPGKPLTDFPTLAELEAVENYVYGVKPPTLDELRARAGVAEIAVVVFSPEYRTVSHTVLRRHADMAFSRTACARVGNEQPHYDGPRRDFRLLKDGDDPHTFRVIPARFAPYVAVKVKGQADSFGPMRFIERERDPDKKGDDGRDFWVPLHKLFSGPECIAGLDLDVQLAAKFVNQKLRRFHELMHGSKLCTGWGKSDIDKPPFVMTDRIADFSARGEDGQGQITPVPHPLFERAKRDDKLLAFWVPKDYGKAGVNLWFSTMQILPEYGETTFTEAYMDGLNVDFGRPAPEYVNTRRRLRRRPPVCNTAVARQATPESAIEDLNGRRDLLRTLEAGGYWSLHYVDHTADGWVAAVCPQLAALGNVAAYAPVAPPDFFPAVLQRELMDWWENEAPPSLRPGLWSIDPLALSDTRLPANIELADAGSKPVFSIDDDTVTAIVGHPAEGSPKRLPRPANEPTPFTRLPDGSNGVFDPGWDVSQGKDKSSGKRYLQNHGLGVPFIEDVKLCAALGSFWPAVVPDSTRMFQPGKKPEGELWPWPTNVPLTDEELGLAPAGDGKLRPWDGVKDGPRIVKGRVRYPDINHVDYTTLGGRMTAMLTSRVDLREYKARVLAMASVYRALGVNFDHWLKERKDNRVEAANRLQLAKAQWAVLSFRKLSGSTDELRAAERQSGAKMRDGETYYFHVYTYGKEETDKQDPRFVLVEMKEQSFFYVDGEKLLMRGGGGKWERRELI